MPALTPVAAVNMARDLSNELRKRSPDIVRANNYYEGDQSLRFASDDFKAVFADRFTDFSDNWVQVVADAPTERLEVIGFQPFSDDPASKLSTEGGKHLWRLWMESEADYESDMAFLEAILAKRSNILVWRDPDEDSPRITFEHPSQSIVSYWPGTRRRKAALKSWIDGEREYATLYTEDEVWKFERDKNRESDDGGLFVDAEGWRKRDVEGESWPFENPLGEVPMVEMPNRPRLIREPMSDVLGVAESQDAINLMWAYVLNAADFASLPARVVLGAQFPTRPVLNDLGAPTGEREPIELSELTAFKSNRLTWIRDEGAKIGQWDPADLQVFTDVINTQVGHIGAQTRTPHHYFHSGNISNISGDTMKAFETGLVQRTNEKVKSFGRAIREAMRLMALADDRPDLAAGIQIGEVIFADTETRSEAQVGDKLYKLWKMGWPFADLARQHGESPTKVAELLRMKEEEAAMATRVAAESLFMEPVGGDPGPVPDAPVE